MSKRENVRNLEKAIAELLIRNDANDFRWITEGERSADDNFSTCLMIDGGALVYFWEGDGWDEMNLVSEHHGHFAEPINYTDIGFYSIAEWDKVPTRS